MMLQAGRLLQPPCSTELSCHPLMFRDLGNPREKEGGAGNGSIMILNDDLPFDEDGELAQLGGRALQNLMITTSLLLLSSIVVQPGSWQSTTTQRH